VKWRTTGEIRQRDKPKQFKGIHSIEIYLEFCYKIQPSLDDHKKIFLLISFKRSRNCSMEMAYIY
jgi:hypothetical protein